MTLRVHYLGPPGTFCHQAALKAFPVTAGQASDLVPCPNILSVFEAVVREQALGVVPVENSIEGSVSLTTECLLEFSDVPTSGEVVVPVEQCLISEGELDKISVVESHPHALPQCKRWLNAHLPHATLVSVASTALAAARAKGDPTKAAIASALAAELAEVPIVARAIQDRARNATRFLILGGPRPAPTGRDKTSLVFAAPHEQGALYRALAVFDRHRINLSRIESRPSPDQLWQYVFFVDLEGHQATPEVSSALAELGRMSPDLLRVFGSYPQASVD